MIGAAVAAAGLAALSTASANEADGCAAAFALEDQLILEWAALGGDPHAQMALAACSVEVKSGAMTPAQKRYAVKWTTIAVCDAEGSPEHDRRDIRMRKLKEEARLSFRRFGGLDKSEKMDWREKDFMKYRAEQTAILKKRHADLVKEVTPAELDAARADMADEFSRMGPIGIVRLAEMTSCKSFGASPTLAAAAWSAARDVWRGPTIEGVYASGDTADYDFSAKADEKLAALDAPTRRLAAAQKDRLFKTSPQRLAALEEKAALARLAEFRLPKKRPDVAEDEAEAVETPALTTALQFALESLGHVEFVNGPDNDFGPTTQSAVARLNLAEGRAPNAVLTNGEIRGSLCDAALRKGDPVSLYHVGLMYQNGWGFEKDGFKAAAAFRSAEARMEKILAETAALPDWKKRAYEPYAQEIKVAAKAAKAAEADDRLCD